MKGEFFVKFVFFFSNSKSNLPSRDRAVFLRMKSVDRDDPDGDGLQIVTGTREGSTTPTLSNRGGLDGPGGTRREPPVPPSGGPM